MTLNIATNYTRISIVNHYLQNITSDEYQQFSNESNQSDPNNRNSFIAKLLPDVKQKLTPENKIPTNSKKSGMRGSLSTACIFTKKCIRRLIHNSTPPYPKMTSKQPSKSK